MGRGRPPLGPDLADSLEGSESAKGRLKVVLQTIAGQKTVLQACRELGIKEAAFHNLRAKVLQRALEGVEPGPMGRPPKEESPEDARVAALEREAVDLRRQLKAAQIREEIALTMPHLLKPPPEGAKKGVSSQRKRCRRRPRR